MVRSKECERQRAESANTRGAADPARAEVFDRKNIIAISIAAKADGTEGTTGLAKCP